MMRMLPWSISFAMRPVPRAMARTRETNSMGARVDIRRAGPSFGHESKGLRYARKTSVDAPGRGSARDNNRGSRLKGRFYIKLIDGNGKVIYMGESVK